MRTWPFEQIIKQLNDGILIVSMQGEILYLNDQMAQMLGYDVDEMVGMGLFDLMSDFWAARAKHNLRRRSQGKEDHFDHQFLRKDQTPIWTMVSTSLMELPEGERVSLVAIRDITAKKKLEQKMAEQREAEHKALAESRSKSAFLANMSHELRTPLNAIIGYIEMLIEDELDCPVEEALEDLGRVQKAAYHLLGLINTVLDLAKVESGRMELITETFSFEQLGAEISAIVSPLARHLNNELLISIEDIEIEQDRAKLKQVIINLLGNACKFTTDGTIALQVTQPTEETVRVEVIDTGVGIPADAIPTLFDAFTQTDNAKHTEGTGLGLAICQRYCELMGSILYVESTVEVGTRFWFDLSTTHNGESP